MQIDGCGAFVTGGASGLGASVAEMLVGAGTSVTIFDLNAEAAVKQHLAGVVLKRALKEMMA